MMAVLQESQALLADGFDSALIGYTNGLKCVAVYDYDKCVQVFMTRDGMTREEAIEFMEYNVVDSYHGEKTPVFITLA